MRADPFIDRLQHARYRRGFLTTRRRRWSLADGRDAKAFRAELGTHPLRSVRRPHHGNCAVGSRSRILLARIDAMRDRFEGGFLPDRIYRRLIDGWLYFGRKNPYARKAP